MQHHQQPQWQCHATTKSEKRSSSRPLMVKNQMAVKPATYSSRIATDIPLYESPGVCLPFCSNSLIFLFSFFLFLCLQFQVGLLFDLCLCRRLCLISTWRTSQEFLMQCFLIINKEVRGLMRFLILVLCLISLFTVLEFWTSFVYNYVATMSFVALFQANILELLVIDMIIWA